MYLCFRTDFTRLLKVDNKINHTVKVVTKSEVIECSGAVLCQHSDILLQLVAKDNELFLDNYSHVQDCLLVLHGAEVALNMDNILDLMKFSVQFGINEIYLQCLDWIENNLSVENVPEIFKLCNSVSKFAKLCDWTLPADVFNSIVIYLKMVGPGAVQDLFELKSDPDHDKQIEFLSFILESSGLIVPFVDLFQEAISYANVGIVLPILCKNVDKLSRLPLNSLRSVVAKINSSAAKSATKIINDHTTFKDKVLSIYLHSKSIFCNVPQYIPMGATCLADVIVRDKLWKNMTADQLKDSQKLFDTPSQHFIYSEIMIAWVIEKMPDEDVFDNITESLIPYKFDADYITMLNDKYKALGYSEPIPAPLLKNWKKPNHFIETSYSSGDTNFIIQLKILCRNDCDPGSRYHVLFEVPSNEMHAPLHKWRWYSNNSVPPATLTEDFLRCPKDTKGGTVPKERLQFYGATDKDVHLQFHTDWSDTVVKWRNGDKKLRVGCIQFDKS